MDWKILTDRVLMIVLLILVIIMGWLVLTNTLIQIEGACDECWKVCESKGITNCTLECNCENLTAR